MLRASSTGRFSQLMDQAREESMEQVKPGDEDRVFYKLSTPKKLVVMLGGPTMNLVIAVVLLGGIVTLYGIGEITARVSAVSQCVQTVPANGTASTTCSPSDPQAPANVAGIRPGDRIISLAGQPVSSWEDVRALVRPNGGKQIKVVVERDGRRLDLTATPILNNVPRVDAGRQPRPWVLTARPSLIALGFMGFSPSAEIVRQPLTAVPAVIGDQISRTAGVVLRIPQKMEGIAKAAFGGGVRDPSLMSVVGVGRVAGEVADGQLSGVTGSNSVSSKLVFLLSLIASLNIALFVFNLIPLLPLDGGHAAGALWEGLKRQVARLRGRPNPGYVDVAKALPVAYVVSIALIGMSVLLIYADVVNPIKFGG